MQPTRTETDQSQQGLQGLFWTGLVGLVLIDQISKIWAMQTLRFAPSVSWLGDLFRLTYAENSGAFLSLGADWPPLARFVMMVGVNAVLLTCLAAVLLVQPKIAWRWKLGWGLVLAGGVGNLIDRLLYQGHVIDFLNVGLGNLRTGIFNVADMYITFGIGWLFVVSLKTPAPPEPPSNPPGTEGPPHQETTPDASPAAEDHPPQEPEAQRPESARCSRIQSNESSPAAKLVGLVVLLRSGVFKPRRWAVLAGLWGGLIMWGWAGGTTLQAETVIRKAGSQGGKMALNGEILDYNRRELIIRVKSPDSIQHVPEDQIIDVQPYFLEAHRKAEEALAEQNYAQARELAQEALPLEKRKWARREILALLIQIARQERNWQAAAIHFEAMLESNRETRHRDLMPLMWRQESLSSLDRDFATRELDSGQAELRLISASWLLEIPGWEGRAAQVLKDLLVNPEDSVRHWARCQLWRVRLQEGNISDGDLRQWERQLRNLPESYWAGPMFVLAQGYEQRVQPEQAAARYLWIPIMDPRQSDLAGSALLKAADLLTSVGQTDAAQRLRREAQDRFSTSPTP